MRSVSNGVPADLFARRGARLFAQNKKGNSYDDSSLSFQLLIQES